MDIRESITLVNNVLKSFNLINDTYTLFVKDDIKTINIDENITLGNQIKYARQLKRITQEELARTLGVDSCTIKQIENKTYKQLHSTTIITNIIDYLDIRDKIKINDDYLEFILKKKQHEIFDFRIKYNIALIDFANMIDVYPKTIIKWEKDQSTISRKKFEKYIEIKNCFENKSKLDNSIFEYYNFIKSDVPYLIKNYIKKESITTIDFAKRMNRNINSIRNIINGKKIITKKQYFKFKELLDKSHSS